MFENSLINGLPLLVVKRWAAEVHGFSGVQLDFSKQGLADSAARFLRACDGRKLVLFSQEHGGQVLTFGAKDLLHMSAHRDDFFTAGVADACVVEAAFSHNKLIFGIRTADCLPLLVKAGAWRALIHAGWRGMAGGVIENCLRVLKDLGAAGDMEVALGPAASMERYEVGEEVIRAFRQRPVYRLTTEGRYYLSLSETAAAIVRSLCPEARIFDTNVCSIGDPRYHSHRRSAQSGRNLAFFGA